MQGKTLRNTAFAIVCCIFTFGMTGCWSSRELSELAITLAIGLDKSGDSYKVSMQVVEPSEVASSRSQGGNRLPVTVFIEEGKSISEILHRVTTVSPRRIYLAHLRMLIIGEELARDGINQVIGYFDREHELRTDFFIAIARNAEASDVLSVLTPIEKIPAIEMFFSLETSEIFWAPTQGVYLDRLILQLTNEGEALALTGIHILGDVNKGKKEDNLKKVTPDTRLKYTGFGVFKHDKLKAWLTTDESRGYNYFIGRVQHSAATVSYDCGQVGLNILNAKESLKGKVVDGKPRIYFSLRLEAAIDSVSCALDLSDVNVIKQLELKAAEDLKSLLEKTVERQKELKLDFLTFGATIHRDDPKGWKLLDKKDYAYLDNLVVDYKMEYKISRVGTRLKTFISEEKE